MGIASLHNPSSPEEASQPFGRSRSMHVMRAVQVRLPSSSVMTTSYAARVRPIDSAVAVAVTMPLLAER